MPYPRAIQLLQEGADVHAKGPGEGHPSPLSLAQALASDGLAGARTAARAVLDASEGWSPRTHATWPHAKRVYAWELLLLGHALARRHAGGGGQV